LDRNSSHSGDSAWQDALPHLDAAIGTTQLLCGIPLARQQASINSLEAKLQNTTDSPQLVQTSSRRTSSTSLSMPERRARDLKAQDRDVPRYRGAVEYIEELGEVALVSLIKETAASPMASSDRMVVIGAALQTLADLDLETGRYRDPEAALNALMDHLPPEMIAIQQSRNVLTHYLRDLSEKDGTRALAWFHGHLDQIRSLPEMRGESKEQLENGTRIALSYGLAFSNARWFAKFMPESDARKRLVWKACDYWGRTDAEKMWAFLAEQNFDPREVIQLGKDAD
jgi:hypothetical protein